MSPKNVLFKIFRAFTEKNLNLKIKTGSEKHAYLLVISLDSISPDLRIPTNFEPTYPKTSPTSRKIYSEAKIDYV